MNAKMLKCMNAQMRKCMNNRNMNTEKWDPKPETGWGWRERENVRWSDGEALQAEGLRDNNPWATPWVKGTPPLSSSG